MTRLCTQNMLQHGGGTVILLSSAGSLIVRHSASAYQVDAALQLGSARGLFARYDAKRARRCPSWP